MWQYTGQPRCQRTSTMKKRCRASAARYLLLLFTGSTTLHRGFRSESQMLKVSLGLLWWSSGQESVFQCREWGFDSWLGNQDPTCHGATKPEQKPVWHNQRDCTPQLLSPHTLQLMHHNQREVCMLQQNTWQQRSHVWQLRLDTTKINKYFFKTNKKTHEKK